MLNEEWWSPTSAQGLAYSLTLNLSPQHLITHWALHSHKERDWEELHKALECVFKDQGTNSTSKGCGMGICNTTPKTSHWISKTSRYDVQSVKLMRKKLELLQLQKIVQVTSRKMPQLLALNSSFNNLGLFGKLILRALHPNQEQAPRSIGSSVVQFFLSC